MEFIFRNAGLGDVGKVLDLHKKYFKYTSFYIWLLLSFFPKGQLLIAFQGEKIAGYIMSFRNRITELCVEDEFSGKGIGGILIEKSISASYPTTMVKTANKHGAKEFYEKRGFTVKSQKKGIFTLERNNCA